MSGWTGWGRWASPSADDYFDELNGPYDHWIERRCVLCGCKVWIARNELYVIRIACDRCQQKEAKQ